MANEGMRIDPPIQIKAPGFRKQFRRWDKLADFAVAENEAWHASIVVPNREHPNLHDAVHNHFQRIHVIHDAIVGAANYAQQHPDLSEPNPHREGVEARLQEFESGIAIPSRSPAGIHILERAKDDPIGSASVLAAELRSPIIVRAWRTDIGLNIRPEVTAIIETALRHRGLKSTVEQERTALIDLRAEWAEDLNQHKDDFSAETDKARAEIGGLRELKANQEKEFSDLFEESRSSLKELDDLYRKQLHLEAPVKYWRTKAIRHYVVSVVALLAFFAGVAGVFILAGRYLNTILGSLRTAEGSIDLAAVAIVALLGGLVLWGFRFFARLYTAHTHMAMDAGQRRTMALTFLALSKDPAARVEEPERLLILHALFRPSEAATEEEGPPAGLIDVMQRMMSGKS